MLLNHWFELNSVMPGYVAGSAYRGVGSGLFVAAVAGAGTLGQLAQPLFLVAFPADLVFRVRFAPPATAGHDLRYFAIVAQVVVSQFRLPAIRA